MVVECEVKRRNVATDVHVCTLYNIYAYYVCIHGCTGADAGPVVWRCANGANGIRSI